MVGYVCDLARDIDQWFREGARTKDVKGAFVGSGPRKLDRELVGERESRWDECGRFRWCQFVVVGSRP